MHFPDPHACRGLGSNRAKTSACAQHAGLLGEAGGGCLAGQGLRPTRKCLLNSPGEGWGAATHVVLLKKGGFLQTRRFEDLGGGSRPGVPPASHPPSARAPSMGPLLGSGPGRRSGCGHPRKAPLAVPPTLCFGSGTRRPFGVAGGAGSALCLSYVSAPVNSMEKGSQRAGLCMEGPRPAPLCARAPASARK